MIMTNIKMARLLIATRDHADDVGTGADDQNDDKNNLRISVIAVSKISIFAIHGKFSAPFLRV